MKKFFKIFFIFPFFSSDIFLLDDPTSSLDNTVSEMIFRNITTDQYWNQRTFVFSTNNLGMLKFVDRVIFIENGRILYFDTPEKVKLSPEYRAITIDEIIEEEEEESEVSPHY